MNRDIVELSVGHNRLGSNGCNYLFQALTAAKAGEGSSLYDQIIKSVTVPQRLVGFRGLRKITLSANGIEEDALKVIAEYLEGDEELRELYFTNNLISVSGQWRNVHAIWITRIPHQGPEHLKQLGKAVSRSRLETISFNTNPLTAAGLEEFLTGLTEIDSEEQDTVRATGSRSGNGSSRPSRGPSRSHSRSRWRQSITENKGHSLKQLHLSSCPLGFDGAQIVADFISHPERSANLNVITLNDCELGLRGLNIVTRAAEMWNFTLLVMETHLNFTVATELDPYQRIMNGHPISPSLQAELDELTEDERMVDEGISFRTGERINRTRYRRPDFRIDREKYSISRLLHALTTAGGDDPYLQAARNEGIRRGLRHHLSERESEVIKRNLWNREAGQKTALQAIPVARVLLTARLPDAADVGTEVMSLMMQKTHLQYPGEQHLSDSQTFENSLSPHLRFPLMDLPFDVIPNIIQQSTDSPSALSDLQWDAVYRYAESHDTLQAEIAKLAASRRGRKETYVISTNANMAVMGSGLSNYRPGPGHPGRSEWLKSLAFGMTTKGKLMPQEEKAVMISILEEVGCNSWDWREQPNSSDEVIGGASLRLPTS